MNIEELDRLLKLTSCGRISKTWVIDSLGYWIEEDEERMLEISIEEIE